MAFKNRLVGYDRNAAQRTKVIDDQSDYFEIDSNTWLSKEVSYCKDCISCHSCSIDWSIVAQHFSHSQVANLMHPVMRS